MRVDVHHHWPDDPPRWACEILNQLEIIMATLEQVLTEVTENDDRLGSLSDLISGLRQQVTDALAGATLSPAVQAQVDAIFAKAESSKAKIDTALNTGVPAPVVPTE